MPNAEKVATVAELTERFQNSSGAVLANYRGLTVAQMARLAAALEAKRTSEEGAPAPSETENSTQNEAEAAGADAQAEDPQATTEDSTED